MKNDYLFILDVDGISQNLNKDRLNARIAPIFHLYTSDIGLSVENQSDKNKQEMLEKISSIIIKSISDVNKNTEYVEKLVSSLLENEVLYSIDFYENNELDSLDYEKTIIVIDFENERLFSLTMIDEGNYSLQEITDATFIDEVIKNTEEYKYIDPEKSFENQFRGFLSTFKP